MKHDVPKVDWSKRLAEVIEGAWDGDTIVCHSDAMKELGERAHQRMCPDKELAFEVAAPALRALTKTKE